jgi:hypothetical protein
MLNSGPSFFKHNFFMITKPILVLLFASVTLGAVSPDIVQALAGFYNGTSNPATWNTGSPWLVGDPCANSWQGLACSGDSVIGIQLGNTGMMGFLSPSVAKITTLQYMYVCFYKYTPYYDFPR